MRSTTLLEEGTQRGDAEPDADGGPAPASCIDPGRASAACERADLETANTAPMVKDDGIMVAVRAYGALRAATGRSV